MTAIRYLLTFRPEGLVSLDRCWAFIGVMLMLLGVFLPDQALNSLRFLIAALLNVFPFLLLSVALAAYVKASGADHLIARAFQGRTSLMILLAAAMGALSPFCSCGVIPLIAALLAMGVPLSAVMAFWLASPLMDPSMFLLTSATLGSAFAVAKTLSAIGIGLFGGYGVWMLQRFGAFSEPLRAGIGDGGCGGARIRDPQPVVWKFWQDPARRRDFLTGSRDNSLFLGKWLTLAFLLESLMLVYVPADLVATAVGEGGWIQVLGAAVVGVPAYLNGYAALPLVAGLIEQGMAPAAGLAFLLAGGVTSVPAAIAVYALARPSVFMAYLLFAFSGAFTAGILYGAV